jgi:hypothetical protein
MKKVNSILAIILLVVIAGCGGGKQLTEDFITVDVTKRYPTKELILQDIFDVEYIVLDNEFVTQGAVRAIGNEIIVVRNQINDGNIFLFDRKNGKGLRKINRRGQSAEEYTNPFRIILNEEDNEIFILDNTNRRITVYDLYGVFKNSIPFSEDTRTYDIWNYDDDHLIFSDANFIWNVMDGTTFHPSYNIISKQDGSIIRKIQFQFEKIISPVWEHGGEPMHLTWYPIVPYHDKWIFIETSSDTLYQLSPNDNVISPFIVRTPSIHSMNPEVFLFLSTISDRYYFMETVKKEYNDATRPRFPSSDIMYDRQEKAIYQYTVYNDDYVDKIPVNIKSRPLNAEIVFWQRLEAYQLVEAYENGQLKGRLKEIAAELDEEDNPVIMLVKHKK